MPHPVFSTDLAPSHFQLFHALQNYLKALSTKRDCGFAVDPPTHPPHFEAICGVQISASLALYRFRETFQDRQLDIIRYINSATEKALFSLKCGNAVTSRPTTRCSASVSMSSLPSYMGAIHRK